MKDGKEGRLENMLLLVMIDSNKWSSLLPLLRLGPEDLRIHVEDGNTRALLIDVLITINKVECDSCDNRTWLLRQLYGWMG